MNARTPEAQVEAAARQAITHLERAAGEASAGSDIQIHYSLGRLYLRIGDAAKAVDAFVRVVNQNPDSAQGRLSLAQAYAATNDLKNAIDTLEFIVNDEPRVAGVLAHDQEQIGLLKEATASYTVALANDPMNRGLKFRRIAATFNDGNYTQAAAFATEAQSQHPDDLRFPRLRARAIFEGGDPGRAVTILEPVAKANPRDTATQLGLADIYNDAGRDTDAERTLRQLLEIEPANAEALNYLGTSSPTAAARLTRPSGWLNAPWSPTRAIPRISTAWAGRISAAATSTKRKSICRQPRSSSRATPSSRITSATCWRGAAAGPTPSPPGRARSPATAALTGRSLNEKFRTQRRKYRAEDDHHPNPNAQLPRGRSARSGIRKAIGTWDLGVGICPGKFRLRAASAVPPN